MVKVKQKKEIYKCSVCGNIVEVLFAGGGELVCCGLPMELQQENTMEASLEKHIPIIERTEKGIRIKVGAHPHPMEENHYIEWIEVFDGKRFFKKELKPGDVPEGEFCIEGGKIIARAYCNIHGLWKAES